MCKSVDPSTTVPAYHFASWSTLTLVADFTNAYYGKTGQSDFYFGCPCTLVTGLEFICSRY